MIVVDEGEHLRVVTQPDHARFAAELLSLWRTGDLPGHPRREWLLFAVREHDNGWREADAAPTVDRTTGMPLDFLTMPPVVRCEIWRRGIERYATRHPYTALLIAEHVEALNRPADALLEQLFDAVQPQRNRWLVELGLDRFTVGRDYGWLRLADRLSLALCSQGTDWLQNLGIRATLGSRCLELDPFPLAGATTFEIPVRRIPNRCYDGDTDLGVALARARWSVERVRLVPI